MAPTTVVLVVDDGAESLALVRRLCGSAGFVMVHARDAASAIALAERHAPAAIITPRTHGLVFIHELRHAAPLALIIVADDEHELAVIDAGANVVLAQPLDEQALASALQTIGPQAPVTTTQQRLRLVIVEPDPHLAGVMLRWLASAFDATLVGTGWRAIETIRTQRPDLVLAELRLPDMDAAELYAAIDKAAPGLGEHTLFMTAGFVADKSQQFLARIPGQWIYKPFDLAKLSAALLALFN